MDLLDEYERFFRKDAFNAGGRLQREGHTFTFVDADGSTAVAVFGDSMTELFDSCKRIVDLMRARKKIAEQTARIAQLEQHLSGKEVA